MDDERYDPNVREQEEAAAAEAARIGGSTPEQDLDPAEAPVAQAGGGEAEGFETAEADLREHAEHGQGTPMPRQDGFTPEVESDRSGAEYGEADDVRPGGEGAEPPDQAA